MSYQNPPIYCDSIGLNPTTLPCCQANNQSASACRSNFGPNNQTFTHVCLSGDCISDCRNVSLLYSSAIQDLAYFGNGQASIRRYEACANVPAMAGYLSAGILSPFISSSISPYISQNASNDGLKSVTLAVTECLTSTCSNARNRGRCKEQCSAVNLLINSTTPNVEGLNACLHNLCTGGYKSLPYADADVIGIGVFASYIMQCIFVALFWFGLLFFEMRRWKRRAAEQTAKGQEKRQNTPVNATQVSSHQAALESFLVNFHKTQCYFSATIQVASLSYGIFKTDMLVTFMLIPLATNGVLPVVFGFLLLYRYKKATLDIVLLTVVCWILSSIVYWSLYANIIPINSEIKSEKRQYLAYQQFMYKLSAIDECGGYSALAVCPDNLKWGRKDISKASHNLRVLTPIIWTLSTVCLIVVLGAQMATWRRERKASREEYEHVRPDTAHQDHSLFLRSRFATSGTYWLTTLCFLAGIGMQFSLLSIGTSLNMMDTKEWGFGQIIAVTVWAPPLLGYLYDEIIAFF